MSVTLEDFGVRFEFDVRADVYEDGPHWLAELSHHELVDAAEFRECTHLEPTPENVRAFVDKQEGDLCDRAVEEAQAGIRRGDHFDPDDADASVDYDDAWI